MDHAALWHAGKERRGGFFNYLSPPSAGPGGSEVVICAALLHVRLSVLPLEKAASAAPSRQTTRVFVPARFSRAFPACFCPSCKAEAQPSHVLLSDAACCVGVWQRGRLLPIPRQTQTVGLWPPEADLRLDCNFPGTFRCRDWLVELWELLPASNIPVAAALAVSPGCQAWRISLFVSFLLLVLLFSPPLFGENSPNLHVSCSDLSESSTRPGRVLNSAGRSLAAALTRNNSGSESHHLSPLFS